MLITREALDGDRAKVEAFYLKTSYSMPLTDNDLILIAEEDERIVGALRVSPECGVTVLRGMRVVQELQRKGIGSFLLAAAADVLANEACYCIPHDYLESFYGQIGFRKVPIRKAPSFLQERWREYGRRGLNVIIMKRNGGDASIRSSN